ncbi:hypothetical protein NQ315_011016 [Exocentrus adspersus]|uniref:Receptor-binding cancer antigen n=1 Tax=Exocentrus adspersus TaxID=1586481 RepID=A0AAV8VIV8_9CUCU|nr:hypothetical protein NQ315_011016 [Exocentrus adspersus]
MIVVFISNKIKTFIFMFVNIFRKALCCLRRRRRSSCESVPLTHVISNTEDTKENFQNWEEWGDAGNERKQKTVQDHIELYRKQASMKHNNMNESETEEQLKFFEDMTPNITKQTKLLINTDHTDSSKRSNRLNFVEDAISVVPTMELREWDEDSGWEGDVTASDVQKVLREKKRQERERKVWEQHQKRLEKTRSLGTKLSN